ncbi:MAG: helix-turn-helix domain-containing protein [Pseudomonadaceae bacterium]|nr:helix-turn-helix domain-containing protein [Pseudomonadaceae bacterium]
MGIEVEHIGSAIKEAREAKKISQRALARKSGIPQSHISKIETKGVDLKLTSLLALARALDLEPVLVPRKLTPAVKSLIRTSKSVTVTPQSAELSLTGHPATVAARPAYTLDEEEGDDDG